MTYLKRLMLPHSNETFCLHSKITNISISSGFHNETHFPYLRPLLLSCNNDNDHYNCFLMQAK